MQGCRETGPAPGLGLFGYFTLHRCSKKNSIGSNLTQCFCFLTNWFIFYEYLSLGSLLRTNYLSSTTGFWFFFFFFFQVTKYPRIRSGFSAVCCRSEGWQPWGAASRVFNFQLVHPSSFSLKSTDLDWKNPHRAFRKNEIICKIRTCVMSKRATTPTGKILRGT